MTDPPIMDFSDGPDTSPPPPAASRRRGRPRSPETIERDDRVLKLLTADGPATREMLVERMNGVKPSLVYLALWRLRRAGHVERVTGDGERHVWRTTS